MGQGSLGLWAWDGPNESGQHFRSKTIHQLPTRLATCAQRMQTHLDARDQRGLGKGSFLARGRGLSWPGARGA
eukprot:3974656-Alexandrium_andersonii.AAC.1